MNSDLFKLIQQGYCVISPTQNLAQRILDTYALQQFEQGLLSWPTPKVYSWYGWCQHLWEELIFSDPGLPRLLNKYESLLLWQQVIEASRYHSKIIHTRSTARQVQAAYELFQGWQIKEIPEELFLNVDAFAFKVWKESYELRLKSKHWIDNACLASTIESQLSNIKDQMEPLVLYAFDETTPQQQHLLNSIQELGGECISLEPSVRNNQYQVQQYVDPKTEMRGLADWIVQTHQQTPEARIGVLVANIRTHREQLLHGLEKLLCAENYYQSPGAARLPFAISSGKPFNEYPLVHVALAILTLDFSSMEISVLSLLLRSPFITGYKDEYSSRSKLHLLLHKSGQQTFSYQELLSWHAEQDSSVQSPLFMHALTACFTIQKDQKTKHNVMHWLPILSSSLEAFGWPGERALNSDEYQIIAEWRDILEKLLSLNSIASDINYKSLTSHLLWICSQQSFQPRTESQVVDIIDLDGASGMQFDFLWLYGVHDQSWPQAYQANPFLPLVLQQQAGIPAASAEGRLRQSQQAYTTLVNSAEHVVASYAVSDGDQLLRPSPLLSLFQHDIENAHISPQSTEIYPNYENLDVIEDQTAEQLQKGQLVAGGSGLFKDQAACPQRAFAKHRLFAEGIPDIEIGLSALQKGNVLHRVLQLFWQKLKHSNNLKRMKPEVLQKTITEVIEQTCHELIYSSDSLIQEKMQALETKRLENLIQEFVTLEKSRDSFTVVATEKGQHTVVNDIVLHLRVDRVDMLEDGSLVIIDYKTGHVTANAWEGDRPDDPQLPLYAITNEQDVAAILIAHVKTGDTKYSGNTSVSIGDIKLDMYEPEDWQLKLSDWKTVLYKIADDFRLGLAYVDPKPDACRYCDLSMFCRINERLLNLEEDNNDLTRQ